MHDARHRQHGVPRLQCESNLRIRKGLKDAKKISKLFIYLDTHPRWIGPDSSNDFVDIFAQSELGLT